MTGRTLKRKPFRQDLIILLAVTSILFLSYSMDLSTDPPQWWVDTYTSSNGNNGPGPETLVVIEEDLLQMSGYTSEGSSTSNDVEVPWDNVTTLTAILHWTDDYGDNDELGLTIEIEGDVIDSLSSTTGTIEITVSDPEPGNYTLTVEALDCPGQVGPLPIDRDNGNDWNLEVKAVREVMR